MLLIDRNNVTSIVISNREQVLFPIQLLGRFREFDILATIKNGGPGGQSKALRYAIAKGLTAFVSSQEIDYLRLSGLLTRDERIVERQKPGQTGARKKWTWCKR